MFILKLVGFCVLGLAPARCLMLLHLPQWVFFLFQMKYKIKDTGSCSEKGFKAPMLVWFKFLLWQTYTTVMKYSYQKFMNILVNLSSAIATGQST